MENEKNTEPADGTDKGAAEEAPPPAEQSFAKIAGAVGDIKTAIYLILFAMLFSQCPAKPTAESEEAKAMRSVSHSLDRIHAELKTLDGPDSGIRAELRELSRNLSNINNTVWNKSCPR